MSLSGVDYLVIGGYLLAITAFGSWFARYQKTTRDYFLTDRSVPWWAICFTIVATETSTLTFIGIPAQSYAGNMVFLQMAAGYVIGRVLVSILFIPSYFGGDLDGRGSNVRVPGRRCGRRDRAARPHQRRLGRGRPRWRRDRPLRLHRCIARLYEGLHPMGGAAW